MLYPHVWTDRIDLTFWKNEMISAIPGISSLIPYYYYDYYYYYNYLGNFLDLHKEAYEVIDVISLLI